MKQIEPAGGTTPSSIVPPIAEEGGQPTGEVGHVVVVVEITPSVPSFVLTKRKQDDGARPFGHKMSKVPISLRALR